MEGYMRSVKNITRDSNRPRRGYLFPPTYQRDVWLKFTPGERLKRSWELRGRIKDLKAVHDKKIFPKP